MSLANSSNNHISRSRSRGHTTASSCQLTVTTLLLLFGVPLTSVIGGINTARYLASKINHVPSQLPSATQAPLSPPSSSPNHECSSDNMPANSPDTAPSRRTKPSKSSSTIQNELNQLSIQKEKLRRVQEENEQLRRMIEVLKEMPIDG